MLISELSHLQDNTPFEPTRLLAELNTLEGELFVLRATLAARTRERNQKDEEEKRTKESKEKEKEAQAEKPKYTELEKAQGKFEKLEGLEKVMRDELESIKVKERDQIEMDKEAARLALPAKKVSSLNCSNP